MTSNSKDSERKSHKDWFDLTAARALASQVAIARPDFDQRKFVRLAARNLASLEFNGRVRQFAEALHQTLPGPGPEALVVLKQSLPPPLPDCEAVTDGWLQWPVGQYIADHGLAHFDEAMETMIELTQRFSAEYAVRPFVEQFPQATFERLSSLTDHPSPHVRRWCSEGTRPRLPWGKKLTQLVDDPSPIWPILEALKDDPELYVRRSVANNLNDIAKDHATEVTSRCKSWSGNGNENRVWTIKHGLRSLIKAGDPAALEIIGYAPARQLKVKLSAAPATISIGGKVELTVHLASTASQSQELIIDYAVHYVRKNGQTSNKVFKWKTLTLPPRGSVVLNKKQPMKMTTIRSLHPGVHRVDLQVNGERVAATSFRLKE